MNDFTKQLETWHTDEIICPHCKQTCSDSWECGDYDENMECPHGCGESFSMERNIEITYTTSKLDSTDE